MSALVGFISAGISGVLDGSFGLPMKFAKKWSWENIWLVFSLTCLVVLPTAVAVVFTPDLWAIYRTVPDGVLFRTFFFGMGWGFGSVMFGLGLYLAGLSLGSSIMTGLIGVIGSLLPMLLLNPRSTLTPGGILILIAMLTTVAGVVLCGAAGKIRERDLPDIGREQMGHGKFTLALIVCVIASVFSSMLNLSFAFGSPIADVAAARLAGDTPSPMNPFWTAFLKNNPLWTLAFAGGAIPNVAYSAFLTIRKGTWRKFTLPAIAPCWASGIAMGVILYVDFICYGIGAANLGPLGTTVAWLIFTVISVSFANMWGVLTGEWNGTSRKAKIRILQGLAVLAVSLMILGCGNYLVMMSAG
jgi:L-rhamnose-H+ transport protein